ncbi:MAG: hypothetical protein ABI054_05320 [Planctomycetota bacterium]
MLIAPLMLWVRSKVVDIARNEFKCVLFSAHAAAQSDWDTAERVRLIEFYRGLLRGESEKGAPPPAGLSGAPPVQGS